MIKHNCLTTSLIIAQLFQRLSGEYFRVLRVSTPSNAMTYWRFEFSMCFPPPHVSYILPPLLPHPDHSSVAYMSTSQVTSAHNTLSNTHTSDVEMDRWMMVRNVLPFQIHSSAHSGNQGLFLASQATTGRPYIQTLFTVTSIQVWIVSAFRCSHLMLKHSTDISGYQLWKSAFYTAR